MKVKRYGVAQEAVALKDIPKGTLVRSFWDTEAKNVYLVYEKYTGEDDAVKGVLDLPECEDSGSGDNLESLSWVVLPEGTLSY